MRATTRLLVSVGGPLAALSVFLTPIPTTHRPPAVPGSVVVAAAAEDPLPPRLRPPPAVPPPSRPVAAVVTVAAGDTLSGLAGRLGRTWQQFAGWNHLSWSAAQALVVGLVLRVPPAGYVPPVLAPPVLPVVPAVRRGAALVPPVVPAAVSGVYSRPMLESLWVAAGGPSWAASRAAGIALCESGGRPWARNPSGATGLWQILGQVVAGDLYDPLVNARNAVAKFQADGATFAAWVCQ